VATARNRLARSAWVRPHLPEFADRIRQAEDRFLECVMQLGACTRAEAEGVLRVYRKNRVVKFHLGSNTINVKHGAFLDAPVIRRAIEQSEK
jgi:hypothetical protein